LPRFSSIWRYGSRKIYGAVWHGQKSWNGVAILARGAEPEETRRGLPGDPDDAHSRYIEAAIGGSSSDASICRTAIPRRAPKFDYKLRWFERLTGYTQTLLDSGAPAILAGGLQRDADRSRRLRAGALGR
jgi:exodeoxyribonuclease-3